MNYFFQKSIANNTCQANTRFMELTSPLLDISYDNKNTYYLQINNTICCFICREYCKAEHTTHSDWLTRSRRSFEHFHDFYIFYCYLKQFYFSLIPKQKIKLYHRHRRKLLTNSRFKNSISISKQNLFNKFIYDDDVYSDSNTYEKFFYLKSIKAKFRARVQAFILLKRFYLKK